MDPDFPFYTRDDTHPAEAAYTLRAAVFPSLREAAKYFKLNPSTLARYESNDIVPPLGYLASLIVLYEETLSSGQWAEVTHSPNLREALLDQFRQFFWRFKREYKYPVYPMRDWEDLVQLAVSFRRSKQANDKQLARGRTDAHEWSEEQTGSTESVYFSVPTIPPHGILGREALLQEITDLLAINQSDGADVGPLVLLGMGGIGKTTIATAVARHPLVLDHFPDGVLWAELGPSPSVRHIQAQWGKMLGVDLLSEVDEEVYSSRLSAALLTKRALIIVDDVWEKSHVEHFLVGGPYCRTLITTRELILAHDLATRSRTLRVKPLDKENSLALLKRLLPDLYEANLAALILLCNRFEGLPLALKLAARTLANEADVPTLMRRTLDELLQRREERLSLKQDDTRPGLEDDVSLRAILQLSVNRLSHADQARFAMLGLFAAEPSTFTIDAVAAVWQCTQEEAEATVLRLIHRSLVEPQLDGQYSVHALLADYAHELLENSDL